MTDRGAGVHHFPDAVGDPNTATPAEVADYHWVFFVTPAESSPGPMLIVPWSVANIPDGYN